MKKNNQEVLSIKAADLFKSITSTRKYLTDTPLYYQGQIPIVAYYIIKGTILLMDKNKICHRKGKGSIIGYKELFSNISSNFTAKALHDTEVCYIDKSTIFEISKSTSIDLQHLYEELNNIETH